MIELARAGDLDAFTALVESNAPNIYRALRSFGLDAAEAEEVAQEVFVRAWRGIARFEGRARFSTWLYRLAFNEVHRWRSRRLPVPLPLDVAHQDPTRVPADSPADRPEGRLLQRELQSTITLALAQLPEPLRLAVVLRDIEGLSTEEAAEVAGVRVAAFKSRLHRGRMELRRLLDPYLDPRPGAGAAGRGTTGGRGPGRRTVATSHTDN